MIGSIKATWNHL